MEFEVEQKMKLKYSKWCLEDSKMLRLDRWSYEITNLCLERERENEEKK